MYKQKIPDNFSTMSDFEAIEKIEFSKRKLGSNLLILGHHYQTDKIVELADHVGDSLELAKLASVSKAEIILFAGVHFMAETADILTGSAQKVILPDADSGCPMADMASAGEVEDAWSQLSGLIDADNEVLPVTYVNSSAKIKAFCGQHGGIVCTSANASKIVAWAMTQRRRLLFLPDRHLGGNVVRNLGIQEEDIILWKAYQPLGGNEPEEIMRAKVILWNGHCPVHDKFMVEHIDYTKGFMPEAKTLVHLECSKEVVSASNGAGSTSWIINQIKEASAGEKFIIGTEISLVERLARENPHLTIRPLQLSRCPNMYKNSVQDMAWVLSLPGEINRVSVSDEVRDYAGLSLKRMLNLSI